MLILKEKCLVLWNIAPLAAERKLEIACKCAILEPAQKPQIQTLSTAPVCHSSITDHHYLVLKHIIYNLQSKYDRYYSSLRCVAGVHLNYIRTNSNLNLEHDGEGFTFTVNSDYIKTQSHYYNSYNSTLDFTPFMQLGLYSPTFITHAYK